MAKLEGFDELKRDLQKLNSGLTGIAFRSARAGATVLKKSVISLTPVGKTKELRKGFVIIREKTKYRGMSVFQVAMDANKNHIFAKYTKDGKRYYYPNSQEYGFKTVDGGYVEGKKFMREGANRAEQQHQKRVFEIARKAVDKALVKKGVKL